MPYLLVALALYLSLAAWAGYGRRWQLFGAAILGGMGLNQLWMMLALDARPFEIHALIAQGSLLLYGLTAGGAGL
ncbi:MAG: hypothetical protein P1U53_16575, partial [Sulfitobacter sp.]|nr:hypothetical protein [Sulfitobacter sp.]